MLEYKIDVLKTLKDRGYTTTKLRAEKLLSERTIQLIREDKIVSPTSLDYICRLLEKQPGDIIKYVPNEDDITSRQVNAETKN